VITCYNMFRMSAICKKIMLKTIMQTKEKVKKLFESTKTIKKIIILLTRSFLVQDWSIVLSGTIYLRRLHTLLNFNIKFEAHKHIKSLSMPTKDIVKNYTFSLLNLICRLLLYLIGIIASLF